MKKNKRLSRRLKIRKLRVRTLADEMLGPVVGGDEEAPTSPVNCLTQGGCTFTCIVCK